ncbi:MAG: hypothetical protein R2939_07410 [Kofleriaceae bacterium]
MVLRSRSLSCLAAGLSLVVACGGGDDDDFPDAAIDANTRIDAVPPPAGCDWAEGGEAHNDTSAEDTQLAVGTSAVVICGDLAARAPDGDGLIDNDAYSIEIATEGEYLLRLTVDGDLGDAFLGLDILDTFGDYFGGGYFAAGHAVAAVYLPAGTFAIEAYAYGDAAPTTAIPYALSIAPDDRDARCGAPGAPAFTETSDGAEHRGNDTISVSFSPDYLTVLTASATDAPEDTGLTATSTDLTIAGSTANVGSDGDEYLDRDAYLVEVGPGANQLDIRLAWSGDTADLDFLLFPVPDAGEPFDVGGGLEVSNEDDEFASIAVEPGSYWLWVGAYAGSGGLPKPYDVRICPSTFTP